MEVEIDKISRDYLVRIRVQCFMFDIYRLILFSQSPGFLLTGQNFDQTRQNLHLNAHMFFFSFLKQPRNEIWNAEYHGIFNNC